MANLGITSPISSPSPRRAPSPQPPRRLKTWTDRLKPILKPRESAEVKFKSQYTMSTNGPNASLRQGPKDSLLLEDYMAWNGANPELRSGTVAKQEGPEAKSKAVSVARGAPGLAKGPAGLAKGSIYQKIKNKTAKIIA